MSTHIQWRIKDRHWNRIWRSLWEIKWEVNMIKSQHFEPKNIIIYSKSLAGSKPLSGVALRLNQLKTALKYWTAFIRIMCWVSKHIGMLLGFKIRKNDSHNVNWNQHKIDISFPKPKQNEHIKDSGSHYWSLSHRRNVTQASRD